MPDAGEYLFLQSTRIRELRLAHGPPRVAFLYKRHRLFDIVVTDSGINGYSPHFIWGWRSRPGWEASMARSTALDPTQKHLHGRPRPRARVTVPEDIYTLTYTHGQISAASIGRLDIPAQAHLSPPLLQFLYVFWHGVKSNLTRDSLENHVIHRRIGVWRRHCLPQIL